MSKGSPVSWMMMAPSITPYRPGGPNNPGLRLYEFEKTSGQASFTCFYFKIDIKNVKFLKNFKRFKFKIVSH